MGLFKKPDFRLREVKLALKDKTRVEGLDTHGVSLYCYLKGVIPDDDRYLPALKSAVERYSDPVHKKVLTGLLISGATVDQVAEITGLQRNAIILFEKLFFDRAVFETRIDIWSFLEQQVENEEILDFYLHAFRLGPSYVSWDLGGKKVEIDHKDMARDVLQDTYMHLKSCFIKQQDAGTIKQWSGMLHQYIRLVDDMDIEIRNPLEDFLFQMEEDEGVKSVTDFDQDEVI